MKIFAYAVEGVCFTIIWLWWLRVMYLHITRFIPADREFQRLLVEMRTEVRDNPELSMDRITFYHDQMLKQHQLGKAAMFYTIHPLWFLGWR